MDHRRRPSCRGAASEPSPAAGPLSGVCSYTALLANAMSHPGLARTGGGGEVITDVGRSPPPQLPAKSPAGRRLRDVTGLETGDGTLRSSSPGLRLAANVR